MRRKVITMSLLVISLLTSCNKHVLRSDIAKFIASFSLNDAVQAYLEGGYEDTKIEDIEGKVTKTIETFSFNVRDVNKPEYSKTIKVYENDALSSETKEEIVNRNEKFYLEKTGQADIELTLQDCHSYVEKFFYKETMFEGSYHVQGMYYGDYINQSAEYFQNYITIDQENNLYIFEANIEQIVDEKPTKQYEKYVVNSWGMLDYLQVEMKNGTNTITQDIQVYRK